VSTTRPGNIERRPSRSRAGRRLCAAILAAALLASVAGALDQSPQNQSPESTGLRRFQPGVHIDWQRRAVLADAHVVLREGPIEFAACFAGKEHESILRFDATATHVYMALGLIGLEPGHPPRWDEQAQRFTPPAGDPVDVTMEWEQDGHRHEAPLFAWIRQVEYGRQAFDRPWIFAGSQPRPDGTLSAEHIGDGIAVVDKPDALLALSRNHVSHDAELWACANTATIPPLQTRVRLVFRAARPRTHNLRLDFRGDVYVNDRYTTPEDAADLLLLARRAGTTGVFEVRTERTLKADLLRIKQTFEDAGLPPDATRFVPISESPTSQP